MPAWNQGEETLPGDGAIKELISISEGLCGKCRSGESAPLLAPGEYIVWGTGVGVVGGGGWGGGDGHEHPESSAAGVSVAAKLNKKNSPRAAACVGGCRGLFQITPCLIGLNHSKTHDELIMEWERTVYTDCSVWS